MINPLRYRHNRIEGCKMKQFVHLGLLCQCGWAEAAQGLVVMCHM